MTGEQLTSLLHPAVADLDLADCSIRHHHLAALAAACTNLRLRGTGRGNVDESRLVKCLLLSMNDCRRLSLSQSSCHHTEEAEAEEEEERLGAEVEDTRSLNKLLLRNKRLVQLNLRQLAR